MSILIWNTRGRTAMNYVLSPMQTFTDPQLQALTPDYICMQEAGNWDNTDIVRRPCPWNPRPSFEEYYELSKPLRIGSEQYTGYVVPWQGSDPGNPRCSMILLWRTALGDVTTNLIDGMAPAFPGQRPVFWVTPKAANQPRVGCIHAPSGGSLPYIQRAIQAIGAGAPAVGWTLAGDFNYGPRELQNAIPQRVFFASNADGTPTPTHMNGSAVDYLVYFAASNPFTTAGVATRMVGEHPDHLEVRFL